MGSSSPQVSGVSLRNKQDAVGEIHSNRPRTARVEETEEKEERKKGGEREKREGERSRRLEESAFIGGGQRERDRDV